MSWVVTTTCDAGTKPDMIWGPYESEAEARGLTSWLGEPGLPDVRQVYELMTPDRWREGVRQWLAADFPVDF